MGKKKDKEQIAATLAEIEVLKNEWEKNLAEAKEIRDQAEEMMREVYKVIGTFYDDVKMIMNEKAETEE